MIDKRKFLGTVFGIVLWSCLIMFFTYAFYQWKSENTIVNLTISDAVQALECNYGPNVNATNIGPVLDYHDGIKVEFNVENTSTMSLDFSLNLDITSISDNLKVTSFKYILVKDAAGGENYDYTSPVASGNFSSLSVGTNLLKDEVAVAGNSIASFLFIVYIDGNVENNPNMQENNLVSSLALGDCLEINKIYNSVSLNAGAGTLDGTLTENVFAQEKGSTMSVAPIEGTNRAYYTVTYNKNGTNATTSKTSAKVYRAFTGWTLTGGGEITAIEPLETTTQTYTYSSNDDEEGVLTAGYNNTSLSLALATVTKSNYTCTWNTASDGSGTSYTSGSTATFTDDTTLYAICTDTGVPTASVTTTSNLKATSQTATLACEDNIGIVGYYWGTSVPTTSSEYTTIAATTNMSLTKTVSSAGTYYLACKDASGNISTSANQTYRSYTVNNLLLKTAGVEGTYTTTNYEQKSTATYIAPNSTAITLSSVYNKPEGGKFAVASIGTASTTTPSTTYTTNITLTNNTTISMWFNRITYTISFDANGGSGAPSSQTKRYGVNLNLSNQQPTRTNYTFLGWSTSSNATSATYSAGGTYSVNDSATLYAVWKLSMFSVTMNNSVTGGTIASNTSSATQSTTITLTPSPSSGFSYAGATIKNSTGTTLMTLDANTKTFSMPAQAVTVRPKWKYADKVLFYLDSSSQFTSFLAGRYEGGSSSFAYDSSRKYVRIDSLTTSNSRRDVLTPSKIDLTHYAKMSTAIHVPTNFGDVTTTLGAVSNTSTWLHLGGIYTTVTRSPSGTNGNWGIDVDVTNVTGSYYLGVQMLSNGQVLNVYWQTLLLYGRTYS